MPAMSASTFPTNAYASGSDCLEGFGFRVEGLSRTLKGIFQGSARVPFEGYMRVR